MKTMRGRLALREHFRAKSTETVHFRASFGVRTLLCVAYAVDRLGSLSAQTARMAIFLF
jgi:hypothetical protein